MKKSYDIVIVGAGVIGLTQAVALCREGFRIAILDAQTKPSPIQPSDPYDTRVFALNHSSQKILEDLGIWENIPPQKRAAYHEVGLAFGTSIPELQFKAKDEAQKNLGHIIEQNTWRQAALEILEANSHCDFYWNSKLNNIEQHKRLIAEPLSTHKTTRSTKGLSVNFTGGAEGGAPGRAQPASTAGSSRDRTRQIDAKLDAFQTITVQTAFLIGADGVQSKARECAGIQTENFPCQQTALVFNLRIEKPHHFQARQYFCPEGIVAFLPLPDEHHYSMVWSIPDKQIALKDLSDTELASTLTNICGRAFGKMEIISRRSAFPLIQRQAKNYVLENFALIGDAAHTIHPLAGQGANLGIADVESLTRQLVHAKKMRRSIGAWNILKVYERERRSAAWQMMLFMSGLKHCATRSLVFKQALHYGSALLNKIPPVKNFLLRFALERFTQ